MSTRGGALLLIPSRVPGASSGSASASHKTRRHPRQAVLVRALSGAAHGPNSTAVVIGASFAGLAAARVLTEHFEEVLLLDKDSLDKDLAAGGTSRRGVPQFTQPHILLLGGAAMLEGLFPGFKQECWDAGATSYDVIQNYHFSNTETWRFPGDPRLATEERRAVGATRAFLEKIVRRRIMSLPRVKLLGNSQVADLMWNEDRSAVQGVVLPDGRCLEGQLVVDASGRNSHLPDWMKAAGRTLPQPEIVDAGVVYATRTYKRPEDWPEEKTMMGMFPKSNITKGAALIPTEDGQWMACGFGRRATSAPPGEAGMMDFIRGMCVPDFYEAITQAEPVSAVDRFMYPSSINRHLEKADLPSGFVVLGDAACSFNPIYGQGISMGLLGAITLGEVLNQQQGVTPQLTKGFQAALADKTAFPWLIATTDDLQSLRAEGKAPALQPTLLGSLGDYYFEKLKDVIMINPKAFARFFQVTHMVEGPISLIHPDILFPILGQAMRDVFMQKATVRTTSEQQAA